MKRLTLLGHSPHVIFVHWPTALLPTSFVFDLAARIKGDRRLARTGYHAGVAGVFTAAWSAIFGIADWLLIPREEKTLKGQANVHGLLNTAALGLMIAALWPRRRDPRPTGPSLALSAVSNAAVAVSAWYGGNMVYSMGNRVHGKRGREEVPEIKIPGEELLVEKLYDFGDHFAPV